MAVKKMVKSVSIYTGLIGEDPRSYHVGKNDVVEIGFDGNVVEIYFRAEGSKNFAERPVKVYSGFKFIFEENLV